MENVCFSVKKTVMSRLSAACLLFLDCSSVVASTALTFQSLGDLLHVGVSVWGRAMGGEVCFYSLFLFCLLVDG